MSRRTLLVRLAFAIIFMILVGALAIRMAVVSAYAGSNPSLAGAVWPEHPDALASMAMMEVGQAAARGEAVQPFTLQLLHTLSASAPFAPEPFLIRGAVALREGNGEKAEELLVAARIRDPRSGAARYLLSELYLRQGRPGPALVELAVLSRLMPALTAPLAPALADYVKRGGATEQLRDVFRSNEQLEAGVLAELASDFRNTNLILSLARATASAEKVPAWQPTLLNSLLKAGEYKTAFALWSKFAAPVERTSGLSTFQRLTAPSPFTWLFAQGNAGSADPEGNALRILFTGRENVTFASRVALLPAGRYVLRMRVEGRAPVPEDLSWTVACLPGGGRIAALPIVRAGPASVSFQISPACRAQKFELKGAGQTFPEQAELSITDFQVGQQQ